MNNVSLTLNENMQEETQNEECLQGPLQQKHKAKHFSP